MGAELSNTQRCKFLYMVPVWGEAYLKTFTDLCLPLLLTKGNLGHEAVRKDATFVILATFDTAVLLRNSESYKRLCELIHTEIILLDGRVSFESSHQAMSEAYVLGMNCKYVTPGITNYVFLTPDSAWSDGTFLHLTEEAERGKKMVMVVGLRTSLETMGAYLFEELAKRNDNSGIPNRELVSAALLHLHPMGQAHNWLSGKFLNRWPSNVYWKYDESMVTHAFHMHPLMVLSPKFRVPVNTTIDGDFIANLGYRQNDYTVVTDSDYVFGFEMTTEERDWRQPLGAASMKELMRFAKRSASPMHTNFFLQRIYFRGVGDDTIPSMIKENVDAVVGEVRRLYLGSWYLRSGLAYRSHAWLERCLARVRTGIPRASRTRMRLRRLVSRFR